ncbi:HNH endonuclease [Bacillus sp. NPDC077027]|uniref:HNH endonuclease n=1 Tax=Bacillus sp. NPDC077027 TaxID=3390548 RepID=UPI003CFBE6F6
MAKKSIGQCELCGRSNVRRTEHHLTPREEGGTFLPTAFLCLPCHKQIHALYTNQELAARLNTIEALRQDEKLVPYIKWIRRQPASKLVKTRKTRERRGK